MNTTDYKSYSASMQFDNDDKIIVGRVLDIADLITFHGDLVASFEAAFLAAVDGYVDACGRLGDAPERPASGRMMLRVAPKVHATALKAAARIGLSLNKWAEQVLQRAGQG